MGRWRLVPALRDRDGRTWTPSPCARWWMDRYAVRHPGWAVVQIQVER
jgi:hypothetical protein